MTAFGLPPDLEPPVDEVSKPWWDATRARRLVIQHCPQCGSWQHYPRALCMQCGALDPPFAAVTGTGTIDTYTEVRRAPDAGRPVPYVVARIRLTEGPMLLANILDGAGRGDLIDQPVHVDWAPLADGRHLPLFRTTEPDRS